MSRYPAGICLLLALITTAVVRAQSEESKPGRIVSGMLRSEVIVEDINYQTRQIKLIDADGNRFTVVADDAVTNLTQIKPRDRIVTEYAEAVAIVVVPAGAEELPQEATGGINEEGAPPGISGLETIMISAEVIAIDLAERRLTLTDSSGNTRSVKVAEDTPIEMINVGDEVRVRLTRAVAISIEPPPARTRP